MAEGQHRGVERSTAEEGHVPGILGTFTVTGYALQSSPPVAVIVAVNVPIRTRGIARL
jgi:hypothetical protein